MAASEHPHYHARREAMAAKNDLQRWQRRWAELAGVAIDARGYVRDAAANFRRPLSVAAAAAFGRSSEQEPGRTRPARLRAVFSSAALVANVFDYWSGRDLGPLLAALEAPGDAARLEFEAPFPTGLEGDPPAVDVALRLSSGGILAIESKFSEWLVRRPRNKAVLKTKYFPARQRIWQSAGLPACQALAEDVQAGRSRFKHLHAAQLLKHALALALAAPGRFSLLYLYYDWPGRVAVVHAAEIAAFAARVGAETGFRALTYQELYRRLRGSGDVDADYLGYLGQRYFGGAR
jgi:hypothetical protein